MYNKIDLLGLFYPFAESLSYNVGPLVQKVCEVACLHVYKPVSVCGRDCMEIMECTVGLCRPTMSVVAAQEWSFGLATHRPERSATNPLFVPIDPLLFVLHGDQI